MYSMVLMLATTSGGEAPAFHGRLAACFCAKHAAPAGCCGGGCCGGAPVYGCCGGGCYGGCWGGAGMGAGTGVSSYAIYGMGYRTGPVVTFNPYGSTNINPPDTSDKVATLRVSLPRDAKLFVDGRETAAKGTSREFATPALPYGHDFYYDLRAEMIVDGKPVVEEKRLFVRAGGTAIESFDKLLAAAPLKGDVVASK
jgi:uncharacterized protein (TIGR03000 family)